MAGTADGLRAAVDAVVQQDLAALSLDQLQEQVGAVAGQVQRLSGFTALAMGRLHRRTGGELTTDGGRSRSVAGWAADATRDSASAAGRLIRTAGALEEGLPLVAQAVLDGVVGFGHAQVLTRLVGAVDAASLLECQESLITAATLMDPVALASHVRHLIATWVEPVLDHDEASSSARRYLKTRREDDGSLWGSFRLSAGDAESVLTALEPLARQQGLTDTRSAAQRRADALVDVCEQVLRHGELPDAGGQRPQLSYVVPADWAAGRAAEHACRDCSRCSQHSPPTFADLVAAGVPTRPTDPSGQRGSAAPGRPVVAAEHACATAAWTGPQTRSRIEALLCDARLSRVLLDEVGQVKGLESLTDDPTPAQRRLLAARDLGCVARGCTRAPALCDAHHLVGRAQGGPTTLSNLVLLCRRHHVLWHLGKIRLRDLRIPWHTDLPAPNGPPDVRAGVSSRRDGTPLFDVVAVT
jgi:hypothetical protein